MIAACVRARLWDGAKAPRRNPSLVWIVEPDMNVPEVPEAAELWAAISTEETFEPGDSGDITICPDASLFDDCESLGSSPVATVLVPPEALELIMNDPRDVAT